MAPASRRPEMKAEVTAPASLLEVPLLDKNPSNQEHTKTYETQKEGSRQSSFPKANQSRQSADIGWRCGGVGGESRIQRVEPRRKISFQFSVLEEKVLPSHTLTDNKVRFGPSRESEEI